MTSKEFTKTCKLVAKTFANGNLTFSEKFSKVEGLTFELCKEFKENQYWESKGVGRDYLTILNFYNVSLSSFNPVVADDGSYFIFLPFAMQTWKQRFPSIAGGWELISDNCQIQDFEKIVENYNKNN
jgi:hypothetical protein